MVYLKSNKGDVMALQNSTYDKIKLLYKLSCLSWFIKQHAMNDMQDHAEEIQFLKELSADIEKNIAKLKIMTCK